ncbi:hypothetical protein [Acinetobacter sp. Marseille-Q1623]|uniref:hypothetical protein n=1 Tax=Acinetobacter sp. Marseille-Q1623 TaxID=2697501 RepID=UPI001C2D4862|nr:hypothetical protein [Acinetobacter sp. Marseille-Q1623]
MEQYIEFINKIQKNKAHAEINFLNQTLKQLFAFIGSFSKHKGSTAHDIDDQFLFLQFSNLFELYYDQHRCVSEYSNILYIRDLRLNDLFKHLISQSCKNILLNEQFMRQNVYSVQPHCPSGVSLSHWTLKIQLIFVDFILNTDMNPKTVSNKTLCYTTIMIVLNIDLKDDNG